MYLATASPALHYVENEMQLGSKHKIQNSDLFRSNVDIQPPP